MSSPIGLHVIGGNGGSKFSFTGYNNGATLEKIWVWVGGWQVKAVRVWLSDGRSQIFGQSYGEHKEYKFKPDERFTSLSLWGNGAGSRLGAIKFSTNKGGEFFASMTRWGLKTEYPINIGSGYCLGVVGRAGEDIDCMGFMFLNAVQSMVLSNVNYPTIHQLIPVVTEEEIKSMTYTNNSSATQKQKIEISKKITKSHSWSVSESVTTQFSLKVTAKIPFVDITAGYSFSTGFEGTYSQQVAEEITETLSTDIDVPSNKKVEVGITIGRASFDLPYTGTVVISCKNGSVFQYPTQGYYKGTTYTGIKVNTEESAL